MAASVEQYVDERGTCPFAEWFDELPAAHAAKVTSIIERLANGHRSGLKPVGQGVSEWRIDWGPGIRLYLAFEGSTLVILLGGGTKSRQQADIDRAILRWADYKRRKQVKD